MRNSSITWTVHCSFYKLLKRSSVFWKLQRQINLRFCGMLNGRLVRRLKKGLVLNLLARQILSHYSFQVFLSSKFFLLVLKTFIVSLNLLFYVWNIESIHIAWSHFKTLAMFFLKVILRNIQNLVCSLIYLMNRLIEVEVFWERILLNYHTLVYWTFALRSFLFTTSRPFNQHLGNFLIEDTFFNAFDSSLRLWR